ncbi:MAG: AMP-binding protein [Rhodospirillales bacterium]|nr:AMP-binding protein [Rhodospirillales bacterium]
MNLVRAFQSIVRHHASFPAIRDDHRSFTWWEFADRVRRAAGMLAKAGVGPGDRFAILSRNGFRVEELKWGGHWLGAVPVPVNFRLAPTEIAPILDDAQCAHLFVENPFLALFEHSALTARRAGVIAFGNASGADAPTYEAALAEADPVAAADPDPDSDALLLYTGGTTGRSKGVRLSHTNILTNAAAFGLGVGARRDQVYLHAAPMFHSADLLAMGWFLQGATQCYLPLFSPTTFLETIRRHRIGAVVTVPTMLIGTISDPAFATADFSSLQVLIYGAAPMSAEWILRVAEAFPAVDLLNCYGLTETAPDLTIFNAREFRAAIAKARATGERGGPLTSVGKPNILSELKVVDGQGREVAAGEVGELIARGPNITKGYLGLPEETAKALRGGWLYTGDIARIDEAGYVYLLDRAKDLIITGGENVYSSEVEGVLARHPAVQEAVIIGVPDPRLGETIMAVIVLRAGAAASEDELTRHCRQSLGGYKIPRRYAFVEALPKSALGKVLKNTLRQTYAGA